MKFSFFIDDGQMAIDGEDPNAVIAVTSDMYDVAALQLGIFSSKIFFHCFAIVHIESIAGSDPQVSFFIGTHIHYTEVGESITGVEMPEGDIALPVQAQAADQERYIYD